MNREREFNFTEANEGSEEKALLNDTHAGLLSSRK